MKRFTEFLTTWGGFIALCLVTLTLIALFILCECRCDSALLRILAGFGTMPLAGVGVLAAVFNLKSNIKM